MLQRLLQDPRPGMQALILYPMNALVNDQVKRLRKLLCKQKNDSNLVRFGFYTSRTEKIHSKAQETIRRELEGTDRQELISLFDETERRRLEKLSVADLVDEAVKKVKKVQAISREEIWISPPQILITNYSMLEHMLMRPKERGDIFEKSKYFSMLILDEAHTYSGSTGTEVAMLLRRFKLSLGIKKRGQVQAIATSASLGDPSEVGIKKKVCDFATELFDEDFSEKNVIWGRRISPEKRFGKPYQIGSITEEELYEIYESLGVESILSSVDSAQEALKNLVPPKVLAEAKEISNNDVHVFLWHALARHPHVRRLMQVLDNGPLPWSHVAAHPLLWSVPLSVDGEVDPLELPKALKALSNLVQIVTCARRSPDEQPLIPIRLHLLYRSMEGLFACINPRCPGALSNQETNRNALGYGKIYLERRTRCEACTAPVLELSSCRKCGEVFAIAVSKDKILAEVPRSIENIEENQNILHLTPVMRGILSSDEESGDSDADEAESKGADKQAVLNGGYILKPMMLSREEKKWQFINKQSGSQDQENQFGGESYQLFKYAKDEKIKNQASTDSELSLTCCPACGARKKRQGLMSRFTSFTDAPLSVVIDQLFDLLSDGANPSSNIAQCNGIAKIEKPDSKVLTFSDGRQDAAYFASDFQRSHTEILYRQSIWQAFLLAAEENTASIDKVETLLIGILRHSSIPNPDRQADRHHKSYRSDEQNRNLRINIASKDLDDLARRRAREILLCEFGVPSARRSSMEALGLLACHIDSIPELLVEQVCNIFTWQIQPNHERALVFLYGLTDELRLLGAVDIEGASNYYSETGGDGSGRPGILGPNGQPKKFLQKAKIDGSKQTEVIVFKPRPNKDGSLNKSQNRVISFVEKAIGMMPTWEIMSQLFEALVDSGFLIEYRGQGYQLAWRKNVLLKSGTDWFECPCCKQLFHKPGLESIDKEKIPNSYLCPAHKCQGVLSPRKTGDERKGHYVSLIKRRPISLTAEEHTAQLQPEELSERENRFRVGEINLLSSSTTLELGVDIGELQVVALRNFPPFVSNYQQRAGRAGRRADGLAVTVMYGQRRPHDRYFFEQPKHLIAGSNKVPNLDISNFSIAKRHVQAELIGYFLRSCHQLGTEDLTVGEFIGLPDLDTQDPVVAETQKNSAYYGKLQLWLNGHKAREYCKQTLSLLMTEFSTTAILEDLQREMEIFAKDQEIDWNSLVSSIEDVMTRLKEIFFSPGKEAREESEKLSKARIGITAELKKIHSRKFHDLLAQASILPIYGFPVDVVQLFTQKNDTRQWGIGSHRLQRDRRLALSEYAPGQEIVVDDRVHKSVAVVRPSKLERQYYWVCDQCNDFVAKNTEDEIEKWLTNEAGDLCCRTCDVDVKAKAAFGRPYIVPRAFSTDWSETPKITPFRKPLRQPTSQVFLAKEQKEEEVILTTNDSHKFWRLITSKSGEFFLSNQGPRGKSGSFASSGYHLCMSCGLDLSDQVNKIRSNRKSGQRPDYQIQHVNPITQKSCNGKWLQLHLAHKFKSDFLKLRFTDAVKCPPLLGKISNLQFCNTVDSSSEFDDSLDGVTRDASSFWRSLTYALLAAAAHVIDVDRSELDGLFRAVENNSNAVELIIYDNVASGAGHSKKIVENFDNVIRRTLELVTSCSCSASCYNCLRTYGNQGFHADLDRQLVRCFLEPIVGELDPDQYQKDFARHSNYFEIEKLPEILDQHVAATRSGSLLALNHINSHLTLKQLERLIDSHKTGGHVVQCLLAELPSSERTDCNIFTRRKLADWIESGYLLLYQRRAPFAEMFCFGKGSSVAIAGQVFQRSEEDEVQCLITRSGDGVSDAYQKIEALIKSSLPVYAAYFETPGALVAEFKRGNTYTVDELRQRIGLTEVLEGKSLAKAEYTDRYFQKQNGQYAQLLISLIDGTWVNDNTRITIRTNQLKEEFESNNYLGRLENIERQLDHEPNCSLLWRNYNQPGTRLPHARTLSLCLDDGTSYLLRFDKGLDFVRLIDDGVNYEVIDETHTVRTLVEDMK